MSTSIRMFMVLAVLVAAAALCAGSAVAILD
jgi:hypothetical protein